MGDSKVPAADTGTSPKPTATVSASQSSAVARRIEENRQRAIAIRKEREAALLAQNPAPTTSGAMSNDLAEIGSHRRLRSDRYPTREMPSTSRDGRVNGASPSGEDGQQPKDDGGAIRPARNFTKIVDYDLSKMTDSKGGFLSTEDDPYNKAMSLSGSNNKDNGSAPGRPEGMSVREWERLQILRNLQRQKAGPFQPGMSVLADKSKRKKCRECGNLEIDLVWVEVFRCAVCNGCKEKFPEKYSLLTKTECREDYLLTEPIADQANMISYQQAELKDEELLPHFSRPNPHKAHWHDMMLFLRYQVEAYAIEKKWGSEEALDAEFERREADKKARKEAKFKKGLMALKKRTRTDAFLRSRKRPGENDDNEEGAGKRAKFGDKVVTNRHHEHEWGRVIENEEGNSVKTCTTCGMEVEELEF